MLTQEQSAFGIFDTYVHLLDGPVANPVEVTPDFWATIASRTDLDEGRLISAFTQEGDWPHWEMHPAGEEIVYLLSGAMDLFLEFPDGTQQVVSMTAKSGFIVPRGVWHWGKVHQPGDMLAITRGENTQVRPL